MPARRQLCAGILLLSLAAACGPQGRGAAAIVERDSSGVSIVENELTRLRDACAVSPAPTVSIGVEDGDEEHMLYRVFGATRLTDGTIALVNGGTHQVRFFGGDGQFLRASGRSGQGPGEFTDAFYIHWLPGDTVYVGDYRPFQFLVFAPDGRWVRSVRPTPIYTNSPRSMHVLRDGRMLLAEEEPFQREAANSFRERSLTVAMHAADGSLTDTIARMRNGRWGQTMLGPQYPWLFPHFESFAVIAARDERIVLGHASISELRVHRAAAGYPVSLIIRWSAGDRAVRSEDIAAEQTRLTKEYASIPAEQRAFFVEPLLSDRRPAADSFPAFARLRLGRDGRFWVREYARPQDPAEHRWVAFASDGRFDCRLVTPRFDDVLEFGADYMLVHQRDSLGVERVMQYSLSRD